MASIDAVPDVLGADYSARTLELRPEAEGRSCLPVGPFQAVGLSWWFGGGISDDDAERWGKPRHGSR
jgi:hypothetical protein